MIPYAIQVRLEKAAADNGFDRALGASGAWLAFSSNYAPLKVWLGMHEAASPLVALSRADVDASLGVLGVPASVPLPEGAAAVRIVSGFDVLHDLLRRAYQLARTLPDELLRTFLEKTKDLPRATEVERLEVQRVGQGVFRAGLIEYWQGRCPLTGLAVPALLRASHIKPWAHCETDAERLDVFNGLLLAPQFDAAFDAGYVTFSDTGALVVSNALTQADRVALGITAALAPIPLAPEHLRYLAWHRARIFRDSPSH